MELNGHDLSEVEDRVFAAYQLDPLRVQRLAGPFWSPDLFRERRATARRVFALAPDWDAIRAEGCPLPPPAVDALATLRDDVGLLLRRAGENDPKTTQLLGVADIFAPLPPVPWLCQALDLAPGAPFLVAGYGFSGKTLATQDLALAVATGSSVWGRFPVRAGRVLHIDFEQGTRLSLERYQRLAAARGIDPNELDGRLAFAPMPAWYLDGDAGDELERIADGFDLVVIDSFRAACPRTDENSSDARVPLDRLTRISEKTKRTTFGVIHHARKPSQNATGGARMSIRGSGALFDACGSVLVFAGEKGEPVTVEHEKARISGQTHDTFQLFIEDVDGASGSRHGLKISALSTTPPAQQSGSERLQGVQTRVLDLIAAQGGTTGGVNVIHEHLGGRKQTLATAVAELVRSGRLIQGGTTRLPTLSLAGTT